MLMVQRIIRCMTIRTSGQVISNAAGVKTTSNAQGAYQAYGKYVTLTKKNYTIWGNFNWSSKKNTTSSLYGKTYQAKGKYEHWNGSTYYSLSDSTGKWIGYLNAEAATVANNQGGIWQSENKTIRMKSKNYTLWQDLNFSKKKASSGNYMNKNIKVTGKYQHYNGATYYSLYFKQYMDRLYQCYRCHKCSCNPFAEQYQPLCDRQQCQREFF